jgi:hypothetical protein
MVFPHKTHRFSIDFPWIFHGFSMLSSCKVVPQFVIAKLVHS